MARRRRILVLATSLVLAGCTAVLGIDEDYRLGNVELSCQSPDDCTSGFCVDGVCCNEACDGPCKTCVEGTCTVLPPHTDPDGECGTGNACIEGGRCGRPLGEPCVAASDCGLGHCVDGVCCADACEGRCRACSAAKNGSEDGVCRFIPQGQDPDNECGGPNTCQGDGNC